MLDDDFEFGLDDNYDYLKEKKPLKVRLRNFFFGVVVFALAVVVGVALYTKHLEMTKSYGRIVAAGELYEAPTYQSGFQGIKYEALHPELSAKTEVQETETKVEEEVTKDERREAALNNILKINDSYIRNKAEARAEKYKLNDLSTTEQTVVVGRGVDTSNLPAGTSQEGGFNEALGYYVGGASTPIFVDPTTSGAEYLGEWKITAYCACAACCDKNAGITASGAMTKANHTIAAPKEFPFGTQLIVGGQLYVVEDRGGSIHGHRIDVYFNTHQEANNFGVRYMDVYRLP